VRKRASRRANPDDVTILAVRRNVQQGTSRGLQDSAYESPALAPVG
jgi:hypothetical protein